MRVAIKIFEDWPRYKDIAISFEIKDVEKIISFEKGFRLYMKDGRVYLCDHKWMPVITKAMCESLD